MSGTGPVPTGYLNRGYAEACAEFGTPTELQRCGGWYLKRTIPGSAALDGMGCYPLFACRDWARLAEDIDALAGELVSFSAVLDPFGRYVPQDLQRCFHDVVIPFKDHYVARLDRSPEHFVSRHHRYYARKAMREVQVEICTRPADFLDEWVALYATLTRKHGIRGIRAFTRNSFARQLALPGLVMFLGRHEGAVVGAHLWFEQENVAYSHLAACNERGYALSAMYALYWTALQHFNGRVHWLELGGGSGTDEASEGLTRFKRGWATDTRPVFFCGRIFDREQYTHITQAGGGPPTPYFPAYRQGEFS